MAEVLTLQEIEARFPREWVLIGDPETDESLEVLTGTVLWHSRDRDEVYRKCGELRPAYAAFHYTGRLGEDGMRYALNLGR